MSAAKHNTSAMPAGLDGTDRYLWALGVFVANFSVVERTIQRALWHFAGVSAPTAPAVFSGVRTEGAMGFIRRIAQAQKWSSKQQEEIDYVFAQLGKINKLRNDLLHYGATVDLDDLNDPDFERWLITNEMFVHTAERIRKMHITPALLESAAEDLYKINTHLGLMVWYDEEVTGPMRQYLEVLQRAWRYEPPAPVQPSQRTRKTHPKGSRPHQSSRG